MTTGTDPATASHTTTYYVVDKNRDYAQVLAEWTASWAGQTAPDPEDDDLAVTYRYGHDLIQQTRYPGGTPTTRYFHYDGQMSTRHLTGSDGTPTDSYTYGAYGDLLNPSDPVTTNYLYTGEQLDPDLGAANTPGTNKTAGLYYLRARYYSPGQGRFTGRDSLHGAQHEPITLHKYLYAGNNPLTYADPGGKQLSTLIVTAKSLGIKYLQMKVVKDALIGAIMNLVISVGSSLVRGDSWEDLGANALSATIEGGILGALGGGTVHLAKSLSQNPCGTKRHPAAGEVEKSHVVGRLLLPPDE